MRYFSCITWNSKACKSKQYQTLTICNVATSSMVRETDYWPLLGLKLVLHQLKRSPCCAYATRLKNWTSKTAYVMIEEIARELWHSPKVILLKITMKFYAYQNCLLKNIILRPWYTLSNRFGRCLKEISYIHAEGYAAGELKHGLLLITKCQSWFLRQTTK